MSADSRLEHLRIPPQSVEAEQSVLGGLMLAPQAWPLVADMLEESDFYQRNHQIIWRAIKSLESKGQPFDAVTVGEFFESHNLADLVQGGAYLIDLASTTPSAANIRAYAAIVADKSRLRRLIEAGTGIVNDGFMPEGRDSDEIIADAQQAIARLTQARAGDLKSVNDGLSEMVESMQRRMVEGALLGTSFGIPGMDDMTGGKQPGDLIIIAGRPSMGKTMLALQGAMAAGRPLIFSLETKAGKLLSRMTSHVGHLPMRWITHPQDAPEFALGRITEAARMVKDRLTAAIYDGRRLSIDQLRSIAIREHRTNPVREIIVDHLGYMKLPGKGRTDSEMGEVTKGLKELAGELNVPVVMLMQLNRGVESRQDKRPMLSDLRECGAAEEDADVVAMIYRDGYYNPSGPLREYAEIFLRKNRDGEPGEIWTKPCLPEMRFDECEPQERSAGNVASIGGQRGITSRFGKGRQSSAVPFTGTDH